MNRLRHTGFLLLGLACIAAPVSAGVTTVQTLSFGEFVIRNNDAQHTITINTDSSYSFSPGFVELVAPEEGIYDITGLPANMAIASIDVTELQPLTGTGNVLNMNTFQTDFTGTDGLGVARITLGATAETTGNGIPYTNQTYMGQLQVQINF